MVLEKKMIKPLIMINRFKEEQWNDHQEIHPTRGK